MQVQWAIQNTSIVLHQQLNTGHRLDLPNLLLIRAEGTLTQSNWEKYWCNQADFFFLIGWMIHKKIKCYNYSIQQHPATGKGYIYKSVHFHNKMSYFIADRSFKWPQESPETKSCPKCSQLWVLILHSYPYMNALIRWCTDLKGLASYVNGCYCL